MTARRFVSLLVPGFTLFFLDASATTRVVPDQYATLQSAIDASVTGDEILIRAGTYHGPSVLAGKDVVIRGEGAANTLLDGNDTCRVLDVGPGVSEATEVLDLTIRRGRGQSGGGAAIGQNSAATFRNCRFESNRAAGDEQHRSYGGAIDVREMARAVVEDCVFEGNGAGAGAPIVDGSGGAISVSSGGSLRLRRSQFIQNSAIGFEGGPGGAVSTAGSDVEIEECLFDNNGGCCGGAISVSGGARIERCTFRRNWSAYGASAVSLFGYPVSPAVSRCVFYDNESYGGGVVEAQYGGSIVGNTIAFNPGSAGIVLSVGDDVVVEVTHNIVSSNQGYGIYSDLPPNPGLIRCNDLWNNHRDYGGDCPDLNGVDNNFSADPMFCDSIARQLTLATDSPCASHPPCAAIGALSVGCGVTAVAPQSSAVIDLLPPRPNPARDEVTISYVLARPAMTRISVIDAAGRQVARLADGFSMAGRRELCWNAAVPVGIYYVVLDTGDARRVRRLAILK